MKDTNFVKFKKSIEPEIGLIQAQYSNYSFKPHYHLDYHIGLISHGRQIFHYKGSKHQVGPGFVQIMMPDHVHDSQTPKGEGFQTQIFSLPIDWLSSLTEELNGQKSIMAFDYCVHDITLYHKLIKLHEMLSSHTAYKLAADSFTLEIFTDLLNKYANVQTTPSVPIGKYNLGLLKEYLVEHLNQRIQLRDLAKLCLLSESQLLRQFKRKTGLTPYAWLARLRLEKSMELLKKGHSSTEVAYQVGFYDQAHFVKAFYQAYRLTPSLVLSR